MQGPAVHVLGLLLPAALILPPSAVLGGRLVRLLACGFLTKRQEAAVGLSVGLGIAGYVPFTLAAFGALRRGSVALAVAVGWMAALALVAQDLRAGRARRGLPASAPPAPRAEPVAVRLAAAASAIVLSAVFLQNAFEALAPPVDIDTLSHQLAIPRLIAEAGRFVPLPTFLQAHWPSQLNAVYAACLLLGGPSSAQVLQVAAAAILAVSILAFVPRRSAGLLAAAYLFATPDVRSVLGTGRVDLAVCLHQWTALSVFLVWARHPRAPGRRAGGLLALVALSLGLAVATKLLGALALALLPPAVFVVGARRGRPAPAALRAAGVLAGALFVASPWLCKSWIATGNPVWPFLHGIWGGREWSPELTRRVLVEGLWAREPGRPLWLGYLQIPIELFARPSGLLGRPRVFLAPFLAIALLRAWALRGALGPGERGLERAWGLYALGFFLLWVAVPNEARYLLPAYVPLAALAGVWLSRLLGEGRNAARGAAALILVAALADPFVMHQQDVGRFLAAAGGGAPAEELLRREVPPYEAIAWINERLPGDAGVLLLGEVRGFHLERRYLRGRLESQSVVDFHALPDVLAVRARLAELGVTHLLVNLERLGPRPAPGSGERALSLVYALVDTGAPVFEGGGCVVLSLVPN